MDQAQLARVDGELFRLARGAGRLRLRMGEALEALCAKGGHHELGFSSVGAYASERLSVGGRWASDSRALARRLSALPRIRAAVMVGRISWSMAEVLAKHASAEDEEALLREAVGATVRAVREGLRERTRVAKGGGEAPVAEESEEPRMVSITRMMRVEDAWALEATRMLVEHTSGGTDGPFGWFEWVLAEGLTSLAGVAPPDVDVLSEDMEEEEAMMRAEREAEAERRAEREARAERRIRASEDGLALGAEEERALPRGAAPLDGVLRQMAAELSSRELWLGKMLRAFFRADGWRRLGYATDTQYARERLGMSRSSLHKKVALARKTERFGKVGEALQEGRIGTEAATLIARVTDQANEEAWIERAEKRTFKHLREEVEMVGMLRRLEGPQVSAAPPDAATVEAHQDFERSVLSGQLIRKVLKEAEESARVQMSEGPEGQGDVPVPMPGGPASVPMSGGPEEHGASVVQMSGGLESTRGGRVRVRLPVREELALQFRQLEEAYLRVGLPPALFIEFLCIAFWKTWAPMLGKSDRWEAIYQSGGYRCSSPVCFRRDCTLHHLLFRSRGGTDEPENLTSPCAFCHLEAIHGGRIKALPPASKVTWVIGRTPILKVVGRERVAV